MKALIMIVAILFTGALSYAQVKQTTTHRHGTKTQRHKHTVKKYTCPMHPAVKRSRPGKCPKCHMKLVAVKKVKKVNAGIREDKPIVHPEM